MYNRGELGAGRKHILLWHFLLNTLSSVYWILTVNNFEFCVCPLLFYRLRRNIRPKEQNKSSRTYCINKAERQCHFISHAVTFHCIPLSYWILTLKTFEIWWVRRISTWIPMEHWNTFRQDYSLSTATATGITLSPTWRQMQQRINMPTWKSIIQVIF